MNIHQLRCAVTVARLGSQTRAAEALYMSQPNLSKALKDLEQACGFRIFTRTGTGMAPTRRGEGFLARARAILEQMDALDALYQGRDRSAAYLSVAVCAAGYVSQALGNFLNSLETKEGVELIVKEAGMPDVVRAVLIREADIGVIRYAVDQQNKVLGELTEQGLHYILYWTFRHKAVVSRRHPLAREERLEKGRLIPYVEAVYGDEPAPVELDPTDATAPQPFRQARLYDQGTRLELVSRSPEAYMWSPPMPEDVLKRYGLVQLSSDDSVLEYQDALIYPKGYAMSRWEQAFYDLLRREADRAAQG